MIQTERLLSEFCELVSVDSVSFQERKMADLLKKKLKELGVEVYEDISGSVYGSNTGNLYGFFKGELEGMPLLFSAHMDTVEPGVGKKAVCKADGRIVSEGDTVLGADDAAGITAILEAIRSLKEEKIPHRDIELLFPIAEEAYVKGSSVFDYRHVKSREAYVLDLSGAVGKASLQEPTLISFQVEISGKAAHAGFAPEEGIHAILLAAEAITKIRQGRIGEETTVNIGRIAGGENCKTSHEVHLKAYQVEEEEPVVQRFLKVCKKLGIEYSSVSQLEQCAAIVEGLMTEKE